jgi:hypothetical protein
MIINKPETPTKLARDLRIGDRISPLNTLDSIATIIRIESHNSGNGNLAIWFDASSKYIAVVAGANAVYDIHGSVDPDQI